ncbi:MAG: hypothetical protein IH995_06920 [Proteobacteria bacterium]|nr:hypothetical protein [Pseudomonadota bacterium]
MSDILAHTVLMVCPAAFGFNPETGASNPFQKPFPELTAGEVQELALYEFDQLAARLKKAGVTVIAVDDTYLPETPDAVFPNNWFCTHPGGPFLTFPMASKIRRLERRDDILARLEGLTGAPADRSLESFEQRGAYLEGTGSMVLDHQNKLAYAALSSRTHEEVLAEYSALSGYQAVPFRALGPEGEAIYHTNVMMCIGPDFVIIGLDTIDPEDRERIAGLLEKTGKTILKLGNRQVYEHFAGNMLCLASKSGGRVLVMSNAARLSLSAAQEATITDKFGCTIVSSPIPVIERIGGGSVRCMLAEVF